MASNQNKSSIKHIPVLLLLDVSRSMIKPTSQDGQSKIEALNNALSDMISGFKEAVKSQNFIKLCIITFGGKAELHLKPTNIENLQTITPLKANGTTPLAEGLILASDIIKNQMFNEIDYIPTIVLLSDGKADKGWEVPFKDFLNDSKISKCDRLAIAFGEDADKEMLREFIKGCENDLFYAQDSKDLYKVFKKITLSVSKKPKKNLAIKIDDIHLDDE